MNEHDMPCCLMADQIIEFGIKKISTDFGGHTYSVNIDEVFNGELAKFENRHINEIYDYIGGDKVAQIELTEDNEFDITYNWGYCLSYIGSIIFSCDEDLELEEIADLEGECDNQVRDLIENIVNEEGVKL